MSAITLRTHRQIQSITNLFGKQLSDFDKAFALQVPGDTLKRVSNEKSAGLQPTALKLK